jgi:hypothetical protein
VQARGSSGEQLLAELRGDPHTFASYVGGLGQPLEPRQHRRGHVGAGQLRHPPDRAHVRDRHDARQDRDVGTGRAHPLHEAEVVRGSEEQLRHGEVRAGRGLGRQNAGIMLTRLRPRVTLGEGGDADAEAPQPVDELDQLAGIGQSARSRDPRRARAFLGIAAQSHDGAHAGRSVGLDDRDQLLAGVPDTGEVAHRPQ